MTSLRHKLWAGFGALLAILLVVSGLTVVVLTQYSHTLDRVFRENYDSVLYSNGMKDALDDLNAQAERMIWQNAAAENWTTSTDEFERNLHLQQHNVTLPGERECTDNLTSLWGHFRADFQNFTGKPTQQRDQYRATLLPQIQQVKQAAQLIADMNMSNMVSVDGQVKQSLVHVRNALLVLVIAGSGAAALILWTAGATVIRSLAALTRSARQVEAGDLDLSLDVSSRDELGQLAEAFNSMAARLREFRKLDHERLVRTQQTTQLAIDSLPDAVFIIGPQGRIEIANLSAATHFNIKPGATVGELNLPWLTELHGSINRDHKAVELPGYQAAIQLFDKGQERFLLPRAVPMLDKDQELIGITVILVDVTLLRQTDEAKSSMVATVSHELRTPLTGMKMSLSMLSGDRFGPVSPQQRQLITAAREDGDRLHRIIDNLLNLSRIEAGRANFQFCQMTATSIISSALDPLRPAVAEKQIRLQLNIPEGLPEVPADPAAISSALTNLMSNAIKFTPAAGLIRVGAEQIGSNLKFSVFNTGPTVDERYRDRLFEKFFRVPRSDGPTGAGLGLSIAREIITAHGGTITYDNAEGNTFSFTLPMIAEITPSQPSAPSTSSP
jgi:signal transduction histidine kinase